MKYVNTLLFIFFIIFMIYSVTNTYQIRDMTSNILNVFSYSIVPSLLPFLLLNQLCISIGIIDLFAYLFQFISYPLFKISGKGASIIIISLLCGFPSSAIFTSSLYINKQIGKQEASRIINYCFFPSFSFLFSIIKPKLSNWHFTILILAIYLTSFLFLYLSSFKVSDDTNLISVKETIQIIKQKIKRFSFPSEIKRIIANSIQSLTDIVGIIIITSIPSKILYDLLDTPFKFLLSGFIEFSFPSITLLNNLVDVKKSIVYLATILSFSSFSSIIQSSAYIVDSKLSIKSFMCSRLLISIFTYIFINLLLFCF